MDRKDLVERVQKGEVRLRADELEVTFPDFLATGLSGAIELSADQFQLEVRLGDGDEPPLRPTGVVRRTGFGSIKGVIEHELRFECKSVPPHHQHMTHNGISTLRYHVDALEFPAVGWDTETFEQISQKLDQLSAVEPSEETQVEASSTNEDKASAVTFSGLLRKFKLIARNTRTKITEENTFLGERTSERSDTQCGQLSDDWEYALIEKNVDLEFHLRLKKEKASATAAEDLRTLDAFLKAVAFMHGQHATPFTLEFRRDGKLITDRLRPPRASKRSPHQPFNERIWFNARVGNVKWDFDETLQAAFRFFQTEDQVSAEVAKLLFLCREAASEGVHGTITNIALCSLLDSAVNLVFEHKVKIQLSDHTDEFHSVRSTLLGIITENVDKVRFAAKEAWLRFQSIISNSEFYAAREKFRAVGEQLGLKWEGDWQDIFRFWAKWRPRLIHRGTGGEDTAEAVTAHFNIESRIIGAIHMLVLKLMGYQGVMVSSTFEDKVRKI